MTLTISQASMELIVSGALLFLIGLLQGILIPTFKNSRMALSAHLTAVQCGTALLAFGVIWTLVALPLFWLTLAQLSLIASVYLIWCGITIAAVTGASKALPIAGKGYAAGKPMEVAVTIIEGAGIVLSVASGLMVTFGLIGSM